MTLLWETLILCKQGALPSPTTRYASSFEKPGIRRTHSVSALQAGKTLYLVWQNYGSKKGRGGKCDPKDYGVRLQGISSYEVGMAVACGARQSGSELRFGGA
jgi:hypothetical protein